MIITSIDFCHANMCLKEGVKLSTNRNRVMEKKKLFNFECMNFIKISITSPLTCVLRHMLQ